MKQGNDMHKDLSEQWRDAISVESTIIAQEVYCDKESFAIAREAMINAFDAEAARLDSEATHEQS